MNYGFKHFTFGLVKNEKLIIKKCLLSIKKIYYKIDKFNFFRANLGISSSEQ